MCKPNGSLAYPTLGGALISHGVEVAVFDACVGNAADDLDATFYHQTTLPSGLLRTGVSDDRILEEAADCDVVGITSIFSDQETMVLETARLLRREFPDLKLISGEFFVAAELLRRGLQCSVTFGNAKAIDLLAFNPATEKSYQVQVKAIRRKNYFHLQHSRVRDRCVYVFVILNRPGEEAEYYILPGTELLRDTGRFGKDYFHRSRPGILPKYLEGYRDNWKVFEA